MLGYGGICGFDKRLALIDRNCIVYVASKSFAEYFEYENIHKLTELVCPEQKNDLKKFIESFSGKETESYFKFKSKDGTCRANIVRLSAESSDYDADGRFNMELIDIGFILDGYDKLSSKVTILRFLLGMTKECIFCYTPLDGYISLYRYDDYQKEIVYRMQIDDMENEMIEKKIVAKEDILLFKELMKAIRDLRVSFTYRITSSIRTKGNVMEKLCFTGMQYVDIDGEKNIVGRVVPEDVAIRQRRVEEIDELRYDSLTKVYNKKTITDYAKRVIEDGKLSRAVLVILDVDHFKNINDNYGHMCGDEVLERVGRRLKDVIGDDGIVGRIGGDEFMCILEDVSDEQMLRGILRAVRTNIKWEFTGEFENTSITVSIGASIYPSNGTTYDELFKKADYCMYIAKQKGRDRYVFFRNDLHMKSYEESLVSTGKNQANEGREIQELRFFSGITQKMLLMPYQSISEIIDHMIKVHGIDRVSIFYGEDMKKVYGKGCEVENNNDAKYVYSDEFENLLGNNTYIAISFIGNCMDEAPQFCGIMKNRRVFSTIQCIIGTRDNIKGLICFDRCRESAQWAEYEINIAVIATSLISMLDSEKPSNV